MRLLSFADRRVSLGGRDQDRHGHDPAVPQVRGRRRRSQEPGGVGGHARGDHCTLVEEVPTNCRLTGECFFFLVSSTSESPPRVGKEVPLSYCNVVKSCSDGNDDFRRARRGLRLDSSHFIYFLGRTNRSPVIIDSIFHPTQWLLRLDDFSTQQQLSRLFWFVCFGKLIPARPKRIH